MLINAGISEIIYLEGYADPMAEEMLKAAGVKLAQIDQVWAWNQITDDWTYRNLYNLLTI